MFRIVIAALVLIASVVAGCSGPAVSPSGEPSSEPSAEPASTAPDPTLAPDEVAEKFGQYIEGQYCVEKPKAAWCPFVMVSGVAEYFTVLVNGPSAGVILKIGDRKKDRRLAATLCDDLVALEANDTITTFGLMHFSVYDRHGSKTLATCDVPR